MKMRNGPNSCKTNHEFLEKMSHLESQVTKALANLTAGVKAMYPKIVYIVPLNEKVEPIWKWPKHWIKNEVQIFFVCQHSGVDF